MNTTKIFTLEVMIYNSTQKLEMFITSNCAINNYYNGNERIASQLSRQSSLLSGLNQMQAYEQDEESLRTGIAAQFLEDIGKENLKFLPHTNKESIQQDSPRRVEIYYFHPDHLGTATYLSDVNGNPYQFFLNLFLTF